MGVATGKHPDQCENQENEMLVVSFGGGTNSTAMLVGMSERGIIPDAILFADTGGENEGFFRGRNHHFIPSSRTRHEPRPDRLLVI